MRQVDQEGGELAAACAACFGALSARPRLTHPEHSQNPDMGVSKVHKAVKEQNPTWQVLSDGIARASRAAYAPPRTHMCMQRVPVLKIMFGCCVER